MERSCERILVVDDQKPIRDIIEKILSGMGFEVTVARNGREGLDMFLQGHFQLVLTDLEMPKMDGWTLASHIREKSSGTPIILLTGSDRDKVIEKLKASGVDEVIFKPFKLVEIEKTVHRILYH